MTESEAAVALAVGAHVAANDALAQGLGIRFEDFAPGRARATMTVRPDMANHGGQAHGGAIYSLADAVFGYACNSANQASVAAYCSISYLAPVDVGETLSAEVREIERSGRSGVYDVTVRDAAGRVVALFRGQSRQVQGAALPADDAPAR